MSSEANIDQKTFGILPDGSAAQIFTLTCGNISFDVTSWGAALRALKVPDRSGRPVDVVLGFDDLNSYVNHIRHLGGLIGRFANRISGAKFTLNGVSYSLAANNGPNHLHGGNIGFDRQNWQIGSVDRDSVTFCLESPDMQEGYPGNMSVSVTYSVTETSLFIHYHAESDKDTLCNLTNHAYFNLAGHDSGRIENQFIQIFSDFFTPTDERTIPTGQILPVANTPMDLRSMHRIGEHVDDAYPQLVWAGGYDHNFVVRREKPGMVYAACAYCPENGILMHVVTDRPGIQFYTGNGLKGCPPGKNGANYNVRESFCLETQAFPDSPNHPEFPASVLKAGEAFDSTTEYRFSIE